ncbi:ATP-binding protein [Bacteroides xylanisolvens]|jgi:SpoVK/Ycf46/Vps4 family AAA+-type ATPase|uniref:ATP-binding protein n=1 Tax=Bacteroides xylanisolvens TaxID=371601 RepID=A0A7J5PVT7_9BACE|nr:MULTISPECIES: ATP-binding protein [Bacteroidaceae]KAB6147112.1 ATP-binding protein [Bacteroides xylanisolvens]MCE9063699.1 ATP-binding protein [Bacteroides fragilis]MCE9197182.1 ATP-binding protein [Phocaeicola dorei]
MATANQLKTLIKSHFEDNTERFNTVALQIAAHEAKLGHTNLANDIKKLIDNAKFSKPKLRPINPDLQGLVLEIFPNERLNDLIVSDLIKGRINRIINEFIQKDKLFRHNLENRRKILFSGPPGTGKTMTASIIANELHLPIYVILMEKVVTKYMGETSAKLRQIFDLIEDIPGVYLFDEFDAIGSQRGKENDVGEMRRVLNSFLQFIERDHSESLIIAATNNLELLDQALFRRFDDVIHYHLPNDDEKILLLKSRIGTNINKNELVKILPQLESLSHAEINQACLDAIKESVLDDKKIDINLIEKTIRERKMAYNI